jgi:hypothetical protein
MTPQVTIVDLHGELSLRSMNLWRQSLRSCTNFRSALQTPEWVNSSSLYLQRRSPSWKGEPNRIPPHRSRRASLGFSISSILEVRSPDVCFSNAVDDLPNPGCSRGCGSGSSAMPNGVKAAQVVAVLVCASVLALTDAQFCPPAWKASRALTSASHLGRFHEWSAPRSWSEIKLCWQCILSPTTTHGRRGFAEFSQRAIPARECLNIDGVVT